VENRKFTKVKTMKILSPAIILIGALLPICAGAQTILINPTTLNGSFEDNSSKTTFTSGLVPNWAVWTSAESIPANTDSGSDVSGSATQGTRDAYLQQGTAAYDLTAYTIQAGDVFTYTWDWALVGRGTATVELGYWDGSSFVGIGSTATSFQSNTSQGLGLGTSYTASLADATGGADVGAQMGIGVISPTGANYPEVDNFVLTVVPEPSTMALSCLGGLGALLLKRKKA
jgi:hypothetical protein